MQPASPNIFHFKYMGNYAVPTLTLQPTLIMQLLNRNNRASIKTINYKSKKKRKKKEKKNITNSKHKKHNESLKYE
jgi:hypothetical protein